MANHLPLLRHASPGWAALLPGFIPLLLFVAVHGTRRSYELLQAMALSSREYASLFDTAIDADLSQLLLGLTAIFVAGSLVVWVIRRQIRVRRMHHAPSKNG